MIPRFGAAKQSGQKYTLRPGAYAVLTRGDGVLLTYQDAPHFEHQLPGGGIDPGESPSAALHREVFEETGWHITGLTRLGAFRRFTYMPEYELYAEKLCTIYHATPTRQLGPPKEPGHTALWADRATAYGLLSNSGDKAFFRRHFL